MKETSLMFCNDDVLEELPEGINKLQVCKKNIANIIYGCGSVRNDAILL